MDALFGTPLAATFAVPANIPGTSGYGGAAFVPGGGNPISWAPHPNPPALIQPALCQVPLIEGQEPTGYVTAAPLAAGGLGLVNLLVPGDAQGDPSNGVPPTGLLAQQQNTWFEGPDKASQPLGACTTYMQRQQIGHFLYMVDRAAQQIVVLNSNRMTVLARIAVPDPVELAIGPNLDYLAVTSASTDSVWFIGVDPAAPGFHTVLKTVAVGRSPRGIAWDPGNEDILVCNQGDDSLSVIAVFSLEVRKTVTGFLDRPFDVVITQRQYLFGTERYVYFGWILNRSGELTLFESGPSGVDGWGYDSTIGVAGMVFAQPRRLIADPQQLSGGVWVAHEGPLDDLGQPTGVAGGAVTRARIVSSQFGPQKLTPHDFWKPQLRDMRVRVEASLDESVLTGVPVDLALDDQVNLGVTRNLVSPFSVGLPLPINGKSLVRGSNGGVVPAKSPQFLLVAVPSSSEGPGVVDVIELGSLLRRDTNAWQPGVQSIPAAGVTGLCDYWRQ